MALPDLWRRVALVLPLFEVRGRTTWGIVDDGHPLTADTDLRQRVTRAYVVTVTTDAHTHTDLTRTRLDREGRSDPCSVPRHTNLRDVDTGPSVRAPTPTDTDSIQGPR
mgnify:CR=1 FL=1